MTIEHVGHDFQGSTPLLALRNENPGGSIAPAPRCSMTIRPAKIADAPFIDELQKMHSHMVGFIVKKQIEKRINEGSVLVAESEHAALLGYIIGQDRYSGRDDIGIIYQLNVSPMSQRHLIGASLVKAVFERAAYGCRLFCCWCAQDIRANYFWESIGFLPLAFRTGSRGKQRIHIFWERRVREDDEVTPYWFPSQTTAGAVREDRLVLPIPPGTHWLDAKPLVLPGMERGVPALGGAGELKALPKPKPVRSKASAPRPLSVVRSQSKHLQAPPPGHAAVVSGGGLNYVARGDYVPEPTPKKPRKPRAPKEKHDPRLVAAARELRDRFLEHINTADPGAALLPGAYGKYDVSRENERPGSCAGDAGPDDDDLPRLPLLAA